ncbi:transposable element tc3 transposase [Trichonephila clavipes]|nr:transposable element tc3 transposase [Trichonephila clavipes]
MDGNRLGLKLWKKSLLLWLKEPPVPSILPQVVVQCHASLEILWSTVRKILRYILKWYPYKIHVMQTLKPQDQKTRLEFSCRFLERMKVDDAWAWKIIRSDKTHFCLDGAMNTQNCCILGISLPNILHQQPLHSGYMTDWCEFSAEFIFEHFFFETLTPQGLKDALSRFHGTVTFFNNRSFLPYRKYNACKPLFLCKMEQLLTLSIKSKHCLVLILVIIV